MPPPIPTVATRQCGVFVTEQALAAGWTETTLSTAVRNGVVDRLWRGVYGTPVPHGVEGAGLRAVQRAVGAAVSHSDLAVTHLAAAALENLPFWAPAPRGCVTSPESSQSTAAGVHAHRCTLPVEELAGFGAIDRTTPSRTVVDIAREFGIESAVVTADAALRLGLMQRADLADSLVRATGRPGVRTARMVLEFADGRAESALESRSRWRLHVAHLPPPRPQATILDRDGRFVARVDFLWEHLGVVGEADGRAKYLRDSGRRSVEGRRREALEELGLLYESWGWEDLDPFEPLATRLSTTLRRAAALPGRRRQWMTPSDPA